MNNILFQDLLYEHKAEQQAEQPVESSPDQNQHKPANKVEKSTIKVEKSASKPVKSATVANPGSNSNTNIASKSMLILIITFLLYKA